MTVVGVQRGTKAIPTSTTGSLQSQRSTDGTAEHWCKNWRQHWLHYFW